jgi:hypothetical protein
MSSVLVKSARGTILGRARWIRKPETYFVASGSQPSTNPLRRLLHATPWVRISAEPENTECVFIAFQIAFDNGSTSFVLPSTLVMFGHASFVDEATLG